MSDRSAAVWFSSDGFDPKAKGINGRRVAGESFLRGFLRHADVPEFVSIAHNTSDHAAFAAIAEQEKVTRPVRGVRLDDISKMAPLACLYYSSPAITNELWRREVIGANRYSICGITHTTATKAVMEHFWTLRMAPQREWDGIICTSRAVQASVLTQMDLIDDHIRSRFAGPPPRRPQLPVLPLGIDAASFARDDGARKAMRERLGLGPKDVLCATVARLSINEKFDPLPLYLAMAEAQRRLPKGVKLHLALCGIFAGQNSEKVTKAGAKALMPGIPLHLLDGANAEDRKGTLSGADIFVFPIDNIQETFGLAPVEGMAAGLPVVCSDWDGLRDTVTPDVGFLAPTSAVRPELTTSTTLRYLGGTDNYQQYLSQISAVTRVDVQAMATAIEALARDPALRAKMGAAGLARARGQFDWSKVIPRMQDFWGELAAIRKAANPAASPVMAAWKVPVAPAPTYLFAEYPTTIFAPKATRYRAVDLGGRPGVVETITLRDYMATKRMFELADHVAGVQKAVAGAGPEGVTLAEMIRLTGFPERRVERCLIWLLKYDFVQETGDGQ